LKEFCIPGDHIPAHPGLGINHIKQDIIQKLDFAARGKRILVGLL
jgi:hypothetical protein